MEQLSANDPKPAPPVDVPDAFERLSSRQERLRDEIDDIHQQLAEKKKPWYKQPTTLMSIAGTVFAVLSGIYSIQSARQQNVVKSAADLETIVTDIIQVRADEIQDSSTAHNDFAGYSVRSSLRNTKRLALLGEANFKLKAASYRVAPSLLVVLALEAEIDGDYTTSKNYLLRAVSQSASHSPDKVGGLASLAQLCLTDGTSVCTAGEGKKYYLEALTEQPSNSDNTHYMRGQLLARIAALLHQASPNDASANEYLDQASAEDLKITPSNPERQSLLQYIAIAHGSSASISKSFNLSFAQPETFLGRWNIAADEQGRSGTITFVSLPTFPFVGAYIDIFQDNKLIEKQSGQATVLDPQSLRVDWMSVSQTGQTAGYSRLILDKSGHRINAEQYRMGDAPSKFVAFR